MAASFGAKLVSLLVPLLAPVGLGFWQIVVALVAGISAKEVMVSSFIVLFGIQGTKTAGEMAALNGKLSFISFGPLNAFCMMLHRNLTFFILKQNISSNCVTIAVNRRGGFPMDELTKPHYQIYYNQKPLSPQVFSDLHVQYQYGNRENPGSMDVFTIFPGIELIYNDFSMVYCDSSLKTESELLEINYCYQGREECQWLCGDYLYLGKGDLCITRMEDGTPGLYFPTGRYLGITIVLDLGILKDHKPPLLDNEKLRLQEFGNRFCPGSHFLAIRANRQIDHIFGELYQIPQEFRHDYYKIKVLELLLFLSMIDPEQERALDRVTKNQIDIIRQVQRRITQNLQENITIDQLAKEFCISPTSLKSNFKQVYSTTIKDYLRRERMERASALLLTTGSTVADIAASLGYTNQSKFSAAFKAVHGLTPVEYRRKCRHERKD